MSNGANIRVLGFYHDKGEQQYMTFAMSNGTNIRHFAMSDRTNLRVFTMTYIRTVSTDYKQNKPYFLILVL